jgi:hypothetical protein
VLWPTALAVPAAAVAATAAAGLAPLAFAALNAASPAINDLRDGSRVVAMTAFLPALEALPCVQGDAT